MRGWWRNASCQSSGLTAAAAASDAASTAAGVANGRDPAVFLFHHRRLDAGAVGIVALEVGGVEIEMRDRARDAEVDDGPVVPRSTAALRLPAVPHVRRLVRHQHVARLPEEPIAGVDD